MRRTLTIVVFILVAAELLFISCQKELSCETCADSNKPPTAVAGPDQLIALPTDSVLMDGSGSSDPDGSISNFIWTKISGPSSFKIVTSTASATKVKNLVSGVYQFELKVTDAAGLYARDTLQVMVDDPLINQPPMALAGSDTSIIAPANTITLDGSRSSDPDNNIARYEWSKIAGPSSFSIENSNAAQTRVINLVTGNYLFELKVTDAGGLIARDSIQVTVNDPAVNHAPIARAGRDTSILLPAASVNLDGSACTDPENNITSYIWTKISGPAATGILNPNAIQTQVTNLVAGIYLFELKVTDAGGLFSKDTMQATVLSGPPACIDCRIVFVSDRDGNPEIYSCRSDGSDIRRLTNDAATDEEPAWSPDGTRIAFTSDRTGHPELYIMNADGSNVVRRTFVSNYCQNPGWSPDGTRIAYSGFNNGSMNIWVVNATSGSPSLLFEAPGYDDQPAWSPNGSKIALVSDWAAYDFVYDIYTINSNGTGFIAHTGNIFDHFDYLHPSWSPDGARLAMAISQTTGIDQYNTQVGVMNSNGTGVTVIRSGAAAFTRTSWSSDGSMIAYTSMGRNISWVASDGSAGGIIVAGGWNADWQH
jgi:hypothetical protein